MKTMKFKADRVTKSRDIERGRNGDVGMSHKKANLLAEFLSSGKKAVKGDFAEPGQTVTVKATYYDGYPVTIDFSWREYNRVVAAFKAGLLPKCDPIIQEKSPKPKHRSVWYKPSTWF